MRYMGGKSRIAKQLAEVIDRVRKPGQLVWDPFCGGLSMAVALSKNDVNAALINLYKAVQAGWVPPNEVSKETYQTAKSLPDTDPMKAFCGFGCSFGGKWFGGYMKHNPGKSEHVYTTRGLLRDLKRVQRLDVGDFTSVPPQPVDAVLYLDPPYRGTTSYTGAPTFNHDLFVQRVQDWTGHGVHTFVSEYDFPLGQVVWERAVPKQLEGGTGADAIERLYYLGPNE